MVETKIAFSLNWTYFPPIQIGIQNKYAHYLLLKGLEEQMLVVNPPLVETEHCDRIFQILSKNHETFCGNTVLISARSTVNGFSKFCPKIMKHFAEIRYLVLSFS